MGNTSFIINDWFITDLNLKGNDLLVFALIFSFTKDGRTKYYGSISYLSEVLGCSKRTINYSLESLIKSGLIKKEIQKNANEPNKYHVDLEVVQKLHRGSAKIASEVVQKLHRGSAKIAPYNNIYNNINNDDDILHNIDDLKNHYLSNEKIVEAVIKESKNNIKDLEVLKIYLDQYCEDLKQKGRLSEKWSEFTSYFLNSCRVGKFKIKPPEQEKPKSHRGNLAF